MLPIHFNISRLRQPAAMFAPILILTENCDETPYQIGKNKTINKTKNERSQTKTSNIIHSKSTCNARLTERGMMFSDGRQHWSRSCQKIKEFKLKVCSVRREYRSEPSKPHFLKVNFRKTPLRETIGAQGIKFSLLI